MNNFCTVITADYLPYAKQLYISLSENFSKGLILHVLVSDGKEKLKLPLESEFLQNMKFYNGDEIKLPMADKLHQKYAKNNMDAYRWSMKSVFIKFLLQQNTVEKIIYLDSDIHFIGNGDFLFEMLSEYRFLITPHWRCASNPQADFVNFQLNFTEGIYNGGFIGANKNSFEILDFWSNCCLANCEINRENGFFVDQKYLDILPSRFEGIRRVEHKGCNLAGWNMIECPRSENDSSELKIDGDFDPIFIHFTPGTRKEIIEGNDILLKPFFERYNQLLQTYSENSIDLMKPIETNDQESSEEKNSEPLLEAVRRRVRLRTRIQAFMDGRIVRK